MRTPFLALATTALVVVTAATALSGCAALDSGPAITQEREISDVSVVELDSSGDLTVTLGATPSLTVTAGERVIDSLTADVEDGVLRLGTDGESMLGNGKIRYALTVNSLESLTVLGSGDASIDLSGANEPTINVRGSGDVDATGIDAGTAILTPDGSGVIDVRDAVVEELTVRIEGSGGVSIAGTAGTQRVDINGDGRYEASGLRSTQAFVTIRGAGSADVTAEGTLDAVIDGSGDISYSGDARVTEDVSGSGDVSRG